MQDKQQIYGRNDMVMLYKHNKIYGSLGLTGQFVFDTINGENTVVLNNPKVGKFKDVVTDLNILGNSHQDSTTGKQLFDVSALKNISGFSVDEDGFIMQKVYNTTSPKTLKELIPSIEAGKSYYLSVDNPDDFTGFFGFTGSVSAWHKNQTFVPKEDDLNIRPGIVSKVGGNARYRLMITEGQTASPYEPYTGGKPSPSPDYPQEIKNVGKWNEVTQKYEVDVKVTGKNIVNIPDFGVNTPETAIKCYISKNICISAQEKADVSKSVWRFKALHKDGSLEYITDATLPGCFYATKENPIVTITYRGIYMTREYKGIMVEYGTVATKYEPYKEQTLTLTSDRPITKWDKLVEQDGQIGWLYGSKKSVLNEKTSWKVFRIDPNEEDNFTFSTNIIGSLGGNQTSFCKTFKNVNYAYAKEHRGKYGLYSDHVEQRVPTRYFRQPNESVQTIEQWKEWLINNPIELWHKSETEFIPLPQEEQDAIRALTTYHPTTVIMVDGGELPVGIQATYKQVNK